MSRTHSDAVLFRALRRGYGGCVGIHYLTIAAIVVGVTVDQIFSGVAAIRRASMQADGRPSQA